MTTANGFIASHAAIKIVSEMFHVNPGDSQNSPPRFRVHVSCWSAAVVLAFLFTAPPVSRANVNASSPFILAHNYAVGGLNPSSIATGDFNGDGNLDFVTANAGFYEFETSTTIGVFLGKGDGTFSPVKNYDTGCTPSDVAIADINGDGKPDIIVADQWPGEPSCHPGITVYLGNGDGTFQPPIFNSSNTPPQRIVIGDFNSDGKPDVVFGSFLSDVLYLSLGNGNGTFQPGSQIAVANNSASPAATGDFNGDGKLDVVVTVYAYGPPAQILVLLGNGDGTFQTSTMQITGDDAVAVVVADFNKDGISDLAVINYCSNNLFCNNGGDIGTVTILVGMGDGTFYTAANFPAGELPTQGVAADFNGDGKLDLAVVNEEGVQVFLGKGNGHFVMHALFAGGDYPTALAAGVFTADHRTDLITGAQDNLASFLKGRGDGNFIASYAVAPGALDPVWVAVGDFNADGKPDLAVVNNCLSLESCNTGVVSILSGKGNGSFESPVNYDLGVLYPNAAVVRDFNHDGKLDLAVTSDCATENDCFTMGVVSILLGNGDGTFGAPTNYSVGSYPLSLTSGDFDHDGQLDLAVSNEDNDNVTVMLGNGDGTFRIGANFPTGASPLAIASGDFNGDGNLDLVTAGYFGNVSLLLGNGDGTFQSPVTILQLSVASSLAIADLNNDGKLDLVVTAGCNAYSAVDTIAVLIGNGNGTFQPAATYEARGCPCSIAVADFNQDGKPDLAVADGGYFSTGLGSIALLFGNGDGSFEPPIFGPAAVPLMITSTDLTLDGAQDLVGVDLIGYVRVGLHKSPGN